MKTLFKIGAVLLVIHIHSILSVQSISAQQRQEYVSFQVFYDELSPYGLWVNYPNYNYVWIPNVDAYFAPYSTAGQWVMTEYGWTWVSGYSWGWAPFHYGRWDYDDYYGWFWVPGNEWGPSWVVWRKAHGYYGWAPMRPGMNIDMNFDSRYVDVNHWNFVRYNDFGKPNIENYYINKYRYKRIIRNSSVINNTYKDYQRNSTYILGPSLNQVERVTGRRISSIAIRDYNRPGQMLDNNQLQLYRPRFENNFNMNQRFAPSKITNLQNVKTPEERVDSYQRNTITPTNNIRNREQIQPVEPGRMNQQDQFQSPYKTTQNKYEIKRQQPIQEFRIQKQGQPQKEEQLHQPMNRQNQNKVVPPVNRQRTEQQKSSDTTGKGRQQESNTTRERRKK
ncbi:MAG TPA: DUF6600 domain-containing protein [Draconibacterium sp.]|nr:DUF6600 domain-containing protein [Draconibacterium sp.]